MKKETLATKTLNAKNRGEFLAPALAIDNTIAKAKADTKKAEALMREALALINGAKEGYTKVAKATGKWNHPICELGDYGRALEEIITSDEGQCGLHTLNK